MKDTREIAELLDRALRKKKFAPVDRDKLYSIFAGAYPAVRTDTRADLASLKSRLRQAPKPARLFTARAARWAALPAAAVIVLAMGVTAYLDLPGRLISTGIQSRATSGTVMLVRNGKESELSAGASLREKDVLVSGPGSGAEIAYRDGLRLAMAGNTVLMINRLRRDRGGALSCDIGLEKGALALDIAKLHAGGRAVLRAPGSVAEVKGTAFGVRVGEDGSVRYEVLEGKILVKNRPEIPNISAEHERPREFMRRFDTLLDEHSVVIGAGEGYEVDAGSRSALERLARKMLEEGRTPAPGEIEKAVALSKPVAPLDGRRGVLLDRLEALKSAGHSKEGSGPERVLVSINANPATAEIFLDGVYRGTGRASFTTGKGTHRLAVRADGFSSVDRTVKFNKNRNSVDLTLNEAKGGETALRRVMGSMRSIHLVVSDKPALFMNIDPEGRVDAYADGKRVWTYKSGSPLVSSPVWDRRRLYMATAGDDLVALSLATGAELWRWKLDGSLHPSSGIALNGGRLFLGTTRGHLYRFTPGGELVWDMHLPGEIHSTPAVKDNFIFVPVQDGRIYGIDINLKLIVFKTGAGVVSGSSIVVRGDRLYAANTRGELVCFNYRADEIEWKADIQNRVVSDLIFHDDSLYAMAASGDVMKIGLAGVIEWKINIGGSIAKNPVITGDNLYLLARRAFYVIDGSTGMVKWSFVIPGEATTNVALGEGHAYFGTSRRGVLRVRR